MRCGKTKARMGWFQVILEKLFPEVTHLGPFQLYETQFQNHSNVVRLMQGQLTEEC